MPKSAVSSAIKRPTVPLWRNVSFALMWSSVAASGFGDRVIMLAALTLMGGNEEGVDGTSLNAGISFCFFLPYLLLGAGAGCLADRLPRKWIMLGCDESRAVLLLLAFILVPGAGEAAIGPEYHWRILAVITAVGIFAGVFNPARNATIPQIVPTAQLQSANALIFSIAVIASMIGLGVGGLMFDPQRAGSVRRALIVGFLFYAVSGTFFAFLKIRSQRAAMVPNEIRHGSNLRGFSYVRSHRTVASLISMNMLMWGAAMVVYNASLGLCKRQYGFAGEIVIQRYTLMAMMMGIGMLCAAVWVTWMNSRHESGWIAMATLLLAGLCMAALALSRSYALSLILVFSIGFFGNTTMICVATLLQAISPNYIRGRIMGVNTLATTITTVTINLIIWRIPAADKVIIPILKVAALVLVVFALGGLWRTMTRGPLESYRLNVFWHITRAFALVWHRLQWVNRHLVPHSGPTILASNHTTGLDPLLIQTSVQRTIRWVMTVNYHFRLLNFLWSAVDPVAIDRDRTEMGPVRQVIRQARSGQIIGIFPEGGAQRHTRDLKPFQPGVGLISLRSKAVIVPVWVEGTPQTRNMFWHFARPSRSTVIFGPPYKPNPSLTHTQIAEDLRQRIISLSRLTPPRDDPGIDC